VRGADVFVVQTHYEPVNEAIVEQLIMIDAMKRASAKRITAVVPYYGYSRQDKKAVSREAISAKLVADLLCTAGANRVVSVDLHSGQIQGFFDAPFDHLTALPLLSSYLKDSLGLHGDDRRGRRARRWPDQDRREAPRVPACRPRVPLQAAFADRGPQDRGDDGGR
jgi:ribose-phosphate pyrophosphokinase